MTADRAAPARRSLWDQFFFEPERPSPMALVRIAWGGLTVVWALTLLPDVDPLLTPGALGYDRGRGAWSWNVLDLVDSSWAPLVTCLVLVVAAAATAVGYRTRLSAVIAVLCLVALQRANATIFNSGDLALRQVGIAVALAPSGLLLSVDEWRRGRKQGAGAHAGEGHVPEGADAGESGPGANGGDADDARLLRAPWAMRLLQLELAVGYLLSAWAKLRGDTWHDGTALARAMRIEDLQRFAAPEWLFDQTVLLNALTWASLLFEASFLLLVWNRRLRPWVLGLGVAFHVGIDILFDVGFFSWVMLIGYLAFVPSDVADRWIGVVRRRLPRRSASPVPLAVEPTE